MITLGPPWQTKENGYIIQPSKDSQYSFSSFYYEPHCMFEESELKPLAPVDYYQIIRIFFIFDSKYWQCSPGGLHHYACRVSGAASVHSRSWWAESHRSCEASQGQVLFFSIFPSFFFFFFQKIAPSHFLFSLFLLSPFKLSPSRSILPMANGELQQSGILANIISQSGDYSAFKAMAKDQGVLVVDVTAGAESSL